MQERIFFTKQAWIISPYFILDKTPKADVEEEIGCWNAGLWQLMIMIGQHGQSLQEL